MDTTTKASIRRLFRTILAISFALLVVEVVPEIFWVFFHHSLGTTFSTLIGILSYIGVRKIQDFSETTHPAGRNIIRIVIGTSFGLLILYIAHFTSSFKGLMDYPSPSISSRYYQRYFNEAESAFDNGNYRRASELYEEFLLSTEHTSNSSKSKFVALARNRKSAADLLVLMNSE